MNNFRKRLNDIEKNYFNEHFLESINKSGMTQSDIAERIGVTRGAIVQWKSGNSFPQVDIFINMANLFGWDLSEINTDISAIATYMNSNKNPNINQPTQTAKPVEITTPISDERYELIKDDIHKLTDAQFMQLMLDIKKMTK